jgi:hypothetical protein
MNSRHLQFCREVAAGKSQAEAYRTVYPRSRNWKEGTARKRASELMKRGDVSGTIEELRREADAEAIMDCQELRTILTARVRELKATHAPTIDLCRASDSLARVSGWYSPAALAVAVAPGPLTQEERERRINDILGIPNDPPEKVTQEEKARRIRDALGIPEPTPEERARKWREYVGLPPIDETRGLQTGLALPAPLPVEVAGPKGGEVVPVPESVPESVPAPADAAPELTPKQARILARVEDARCASPQEVRSVALSYREEGGADWDDANAVLVAWEAKRKEGAPA